MADWTAEYNLSTLPTVEAEYTPHYFNLHPALKLMKKSGVFKFGASGTTAKDRYEDSADEGNFGSYGAFEQIDIVPGGDPLQLEWDWCTLRDAEAVAGLHKERNNGPRGRMDSGVVFDLRDNAMNRLKERFGYLTAREIISGTNTSVGGGGEKGPLGLETALPTSQTGSLGGAARSTYTNINHKIVDASTGPSTNALMDAWWVFVRSRRQAELNPALARGVAMPNLYLGTRDNCEYIENKYMSQNTAPAANVDGLKTILGTVLHADDNITDNTACFVNTGTLMIEVATYEGREGMQGERAFAMHAQNGLPGRINPGDEYFTIRLHWRQRFRLNKGNVRVINF